VSTAATPLLELHAIGKTFGPVRVLEDITFSLYAGEVHLLAGENGAGKSTLIKILAGIYTDYEGEILLRGEKVCFKNPRDAEQKGISVIHQELSLIDTLSVVDNLFLGRERTRAGQWVDRKRQRAQARTLCARVGLDIDVNRMAGEFPIGVKNALEIAKAFVPDLDQPDARGRIVVMDEPTSALTKPEVEKLFHLIGDLKRRGCAIVYITHKMEEIDRIADRITVLRDGRYVGTAPAKDLPREKLIEWMIGREWTPPEAAESGAAGVEVLSIRKLSVPNPDEASRAGKPYWVENVTLSLRAGEVVGIGGLQGSGASELLQAVFGVYGKQTQGEVLLAGKPALARQPRQAMKEGIAYLSCDRKAKGLVLSLGIRENLSLPSIDQFSFKSWINKNQETQVARERIQEFRIRCHSPEQPVGTLSGGNQQKVVLAKWIETKPRVLLLDEPTRGVDVGAKQEIYDRIRQWARDGIAVLLTTSEMPELLTLSDRVVVMHRGKVQAIWNRSQATQERVLSAAMGEAVSV